MPEERSQPGHHARRCPATDKTCYKPSTKKVSGNERHNCQCNTSMVGANQRGNVPVKDPLNKVAFTVNIGPGIGGGNGSSITPMVGANR